MSGSRKPTHLALDILASRKEEAPADPEDIVTAHTVLCRQGLLRDSGRRRPNRAGRPSVVWVAAPFKD